MIDFLESKLSEFKKCFSRTATYKWFVIVILGLLTRTDKLGVTSFIRSLGLKERCYEWGIDNLGSVYLIFPSMIL